MRYFTVGPTQEYPRLREFIASAFADDIHSRSHRSAYFAELFHSTRDDIVALMRAPADREVFYAGSATEWMERALQNLSTSRTLHLVSGTFAKRFHATAQALGRDARAVAQRTDGSFSLDDLPSGFEPEMIALTHNETSNGTRLSPAFVESLRARFPDALLAVDVVSSAPLHDDAVADADFLFFSVQKGFGMPAGLGVALVSPRAIARAREIADSGAYTGYAHSFARLADHAERGHTVETPNVLSIHVLGLVVRDMLSIGVTALRDEGSRKAALLLEALEKGSETELEPILPGYRSETVLVARTPHGSKPLIERLSQRGFAVASGYGDMKDTHVRIGNFPAHRLEETAQLARLIAEPLA